MIIKDDLKIIDKVSGLKIEVIKGTIQNRLHITHIGKPIANNRDFWFTQDGKIDGTGSEFF